MTQHASNSAMVVIVKENFATNHKLVHEAASRDCIILKVHLSEEYDSGSEFILVYSALLV